MMTTASLWALGTVALGAFGALLADRIARSRRASGDRSDFWSRIVWRCLVFLGLPLLGFTLLVEILPTSFAHSGWHLQADRTGFAGGAPDAAYPWMLLAPWVVWTALVTWGLREAPGNPDEARSLAGGVGFDRSRRWLLVCILPLAAILLLALPHLGGGPHTYPAATWSGLAVLALSLTATARSGSAVSAERRPHSETEPRPAEAGASTVASWPDALARRGVDVSPLATWNAAEPARPVQGRAARRLAASLSRRGARHVAPELIEAVAALLRSPSLDDPSPAMLVTAPEGCGQDETVAVAAAWLDHRFQEATLVVCEEPAARADQLRKWLSRETTVAVVDAAGDVAPQAHVWVARAETLSDRLLPRLKEHVQRRRIGLVAWWDVERYTGVAGANLWAISRRLHRLLRHLQREDARTLASMQPAPHAEAQADAFVRRLLPHAFSGENRVSVPLRCLRPIHVHRLEGHRRYLTERGASVPHRSRHLALVAARASAEAGWRTGLTPPPYAAGSEVRDLLQTPLGDHTLGRDLASRFTEADAWIRPVADDDVLALPARISQGGRSSSSRGPHHVGLTGSNNPYVQHLLAELARRGPEALDTSRRLICAEGSPSILKRHLLMALDEHPDTRGDLLRDFLLEETEVRETLDRLHRDHQLQRREVRFLDDHGDLQREPYYHSSAPATRQRRPLDTVGLDLVQVVAPSEAREDDGVRLRVDPERLTIQAYPHRVFFHEGRRFRIEEWSDSKTVLDRRRLSCHEEARCSRTLRIRRSYLYDFTPRGAPTVLGRGGRPFFRRVVDLTYEEEVTGVLELVRDPSTGEENRTTHELIRPITGLFDTRALLLDTGGIREVETVVSLAQTLRHLLPVHLGIDEGSLEVVALEGMEADGIDLYGVAVVDLYPGGLGLIDTLDDDPAFLLDLLERGRRWLAACPCQREDGCERCLASPEAVTLNPDIAPRRDAALDLLETLTA